VSLIDASKHTGKKRLPEQNHDYYPRPRWTKQRPLGTSIQRRQHRHYQRAKHHSPRRQHRQRLQATTLTAGNDIKLEAAQNTSQETHLKMRKNLASSAAVDSASPSAANNKR